MKEILGKDNRFYLMGISILWIIGLHFYMYSALPADSIWGFLFSKGYIGVDVFLFLSSYGLCFSYNGNSLCSYYKRRAGRIFPAYMLFVIATIAAYGETYSESPVLLFIYQCTGLASFRQTDFEWYVPALIVIYALFPLIYRGIKWLYEKNRYTLIIAAILLSVCSPWISTIMFPMLASRLSIIVLGIATYLLIQDNDSASLYKMYAICALAAVLFRWGNEPAWTLMVPGIICLLSLGNSKFPVKKGICFIGKHSFEIYLAQSFALNQFFLKNDMAYIPKCLIALSIIVSGAFMLWIIQKTATGISHNKANR